MPAWRAATDSAATGAGPLNPGPHGFTEILYAYSSAAGNNGSAFAGLTANAPFWDLTLGLTMLVGRFAMIVPMLAVAGSLAAKQKVPPSSGTFPTHGPLFVGLVVGVILIMGGLTYFPALTLGPIAEQFAMLHHQLF
jgi:K+-transporting ATPase ATPase A chain